jgi:hypothetical protein
MSPSTSPRVAAVADLLKRFSRQELSQLVSMVPKLRDLQRDDALDVAAHFRQLGQEQQAGRPVDLNDPFIGALTYAQYFALSEAEQDALWEQLFHEGSVDIEAMPEEDVSASADMPAR